VSAYDQIKNLREYLIQTPSWHIPIQIVIDRLIDILETLEGEVHPEEIVKRPKPGPPR
jgi:hypothetical protein